MDGVQLAGKIGFDYIEPAVATLLPDKPDQDFALAASTMAGAKLKAEAFNCFIPGNLKITGPAANLDSLKQYVAVALPRAAKLGAAVVVFGSGAARRVPDGFPMDKAMDQIAAFLTAIAPIAAASKITIAI
ncbi:MAG TPA: TIM barrel protein, partial [Phycisphaerae bacterium]|nr:TIM barrel protein [Phycisphaerae bacterium]